MSSTDVFEDLRQPDWKNRFSADDLTLPQWKRLAGMIKRSNAITNQEKTKLLGRIQLLLAESTVVNDQGNLELLGVEIGRIV